MSFRSTQVVEWEHKLKAIFDKIDDYLEDTYGNKYPLHPSRPKRGETSNKEHDGLFNVGAAYSAGYGSEHGAGYIVDIDMATLSHVPEPLQKTIEEAVISLLKKELPLAFPGQELKVSRDGHTYKIHGDLSLD